jgi:hypothetical protein|tara:strand:- start:177 stop:605 length:429 start_codon:yes stop_codon:yes gene_type:complete
MIKLEDRASVVILSLITFMGIFYAIMFLNDTFAAAFAERAGQGAPDEQTLFWMGSWGYIYLALSVGNIIAMMCPASDSRVFFRTMSFLAMIAFIRALGNTLAAPDGQEVLWVPLIAQLIVLIGYSVVLTRTGSRAGKHFGWV